MNREELCHLLRQAYSAKAGCGVAKANHDDYKNIWFVVPPSPPRSYDPNKNELKTLVSALTRAHYVLSRLKPFDEMDHLDKTLSYLFVRREALTSSRMEGTWSTIDEVLTPPSEHEDQGRKSNNASIRGYAEALEQTFRIVQKKKYKAFTVALIESLHKTIVSKDPSFQGVPGQIRRENQPRGIVQIGGLGRKEDSIYNPTPPQHVERCLNDFVTWLQDDLLVELGDAGQGMHMPVRMAIGHAHFEAIHPFSDGNGRVGRMLWPLQMILSNYAPLYLSGYVEKEKRAYYAALEQAQKQLNYLPMIEFICNAFYASYFDTEKSKNAIIALPEMWQKRLKSRRGSTAQRALSFLVRSPICTVKELAEHLDTTFQSASVAVTSLVEARILAERTGYKKNRVFAAEEVIAVLAREFGGDPEASLDFAQRKMSL